MKYIWYVGIFAFAACFEAKDEEEDERKEGEQQGDCSDNEDNDDDGKVDCEDSGCSNKPACEDTEDTEEDTDIETWEPSSEPASAPTSEPPEDGFSVDFVGAYGMVTVENSVQIAGPATLNGNPIENSFFIVLAFENWGGTSDTQNACILQFSLENSSVADSFFEDADVADGWVGWTFSGASNFIGSSPACEYLEEDFVPLFENFKTADFGLGMGPLTSAMEEAFDVGGSGPSEEDWATDFAPHYYSQYVMIDFGSFGGSSGWSAVNFSVAYQLESDNSLSETTNEDGDTVNVLLDISEAVNAPDGFHYGSLGFGWGFN